MSWNFLDYMLGRFGFNDKWRSWIRSCVFSGQLLVLVNGRPTEEVNIQRGLKQGDPLAPFLFLLVVERLSSLMSNVVSLDLFRGFRLRNSTLVISHLQYADDTILVGEACEQNLWIIKSVLKCFELVSGLKIYYHKSSFMGVNISDAFMRSVADFLNCKVVGLPFRYLGLPVGANLRKLSTWKPMLNSVSRKLGSWKK